MSGLSLFFTAAGTKVDMFSAGSNALNADRRLNALIDAIKIVLSYAEMLNKAIPSAALGLNVVKLGYTLNQLDGKRNLGQAINLQDVADPFTAVVDIVSDLAIATRNPYAIAGGLIGKAASLALSTAMIGLGDKVIVPPKDQNINYSLEATNTITNEKVTITAHGGKLGAVGANANNQIQSTLTSTPITSGPLAGLTLNTVTNNQTNQNSYSIIGPDGTALVTDLSNYTVNPNGTLTGTTTQGGTINLNIATGKSNYTIDPDGVGTAYLADGRTISFSKSDLLVTLDGSYTIPHPSGVGTLTVSGNGQSLTHTTPLLGTNLVQSGTALRGLPLNYGQAKRSPRLGFDPSYKQFNNRGIARRPCGYCLAGKDALDAANDGAWRAVA